MAKILVVDDEKDIVDVTASLLESKGYTVISAFNGTEALFNAHTQKPDLIILNIILPKLNGYEVCQLLKDDSEYENIPIILQAESKDIEETKKIADNVKADALIMKPCESEDLLAKIDKLLNKRED